MYMFRCDFKCIQKKNVHKNHIIFQKIFYLNFKSFYCIFRLLCNSDNFDESFEFESRGLVTMKGKAEPMNCWFLNRSKSDYVNIPHPEDLLR